MSTQSRRVRPRCDASSWLAIRFLYNPAVEYLRELVVSDSLGRVHYAYAQRLNMGVVRSDIDAMWTLAPHDISSNS